MTTVIPELATQWDPIEPLLHDWTDGSVVGSVVHARRAMPVIRAFDFSTGPSIGMMGIVPLYASKTLRIFAENPVGVDPFFRRFREADIVMLQFTGTSTLHTEAGVFTLRSGEVIRIPRGMSHRSVGSPDCRRIVLHSKAVMDYLLHPEDYKTHTVFDTRLIGGSRVVDEPPLAGDGIDLAAPGQVLEAMWGWNDPIHQPMWLSRPLSEMDKGRGGREMYVMRAFDFFTGVTGVSPGSSPGGPPNLFRSDETKVRVYNLQGAQWNTHRGFGADEIWFQFRGDSPNESEYGIVDLNPGEMTIVPPGINHRAVGGEGFLRFNIYHVRNVELLVDPRQHVRNSQFECSEEVLPN